MEIVLIGSGSVATHLGLALQSKGVVIKQVFSRNLVNAESLANKLGTTFVDDIANLYTNADIYIYALKDSALKSVLRKMDMPNGIHVHTAGSIPMSDFEGYTSRFGVFYPLQSFSIQKEVDFKEIPICIEACSAEIQLVLVNLAKLLTDKIYTVNSEQRKKLHLAAVFACNFTNYMYDIASQILDDSDIKFEIIQPLIAETANKIKTLSPYDAQTGPAVRFDETTIARHLRMLNKSPEICKIYSLLSKNIHKRHKKNNY
jgi:predicted short-subunit dehydrogenase-like oxidoreductase (DUF2520 family)